MAALLNYTVTEIFGALLLLLVVLLYLYFKFILYRYWTRRKVTFLKPTFPAGNFSKVITAKQHMFTCFQEAYQKFKKNRIFGMYTFHKPCLVIADPNLIRIVLTKEFSHFHDRGLYCNEDLDPLTGNIFLLPGQKWKNLRVKLTPIFTSGKMKHMFGTVKEKGDTLRQLFETKARDKSVIEIKDIFARYATDVIMTTAFGVNCDSLNDPECELRYWGKRIVEPLTWRNTLGFFAPQVLYSLSIPFFSRDICHFFSKMFRDNYEFRRTNNERRKDFMDLLIQLIETGHLEEVGGDEKSQVRHISETIDGKISLIEGMAQAFVFYVAGFETSSATASHCLYELALNQEIQDKVREEINSVIKDEGDVTYNAVNEMPYLHKVVSETLRINPPVGILNRVCTQEFKLPSTDLSIEKGVDLVIPVLGLHRDPDIYPDPSKFDPERFSEKNIATRHPYTYLPFGEGPRICIGTRFGLTQTKVALINALRGCRYTIGPNQPVPYKIDCGSLIFSSTNIHLRVEPI